MNITNEWPMVKLGELVEKTSETKGGSEIPVYSVTKHAGFVSNYFKKNVHSKDQSKYKVVNEGEFAYATIHLDEGSIGIAPEKAAVSPMYTTFRVSSPKVDPEFLLRFLKSDAALAQYSILGTGSIERRKNINFEVFSRLTVPLPPLAEQQRIAEILDSSATVIQQIETQLQLLADLATFHTTRYLEHEKLAPLSNFGSFSGGMTPDKKNPTYWGGLIRWFTTKDLKKSVLVDSTDHITDQALAETSLKLIGTPSIAFSLRGMSLAHTLPMSRIPAKSAVNQDLKIFIPHYPDHLLVLYALIKAKTSWILSKVSTSGHGTKKLDFVHLRNLELPMLSDAEFAQLDEVLTQIEELEQKKNQKLESLRELHQSLSTRAFTGQL